MQNSLSYQFQFAMVMLAVFFWLLNWIPFVNIFTNALYWLIWVFIFFIKYKPLLAEITKTGVTIGKLGLKIGIISVIAFILGEIPIVSILPWDVAANYWINRMIKQLLAEVDKIKEQAKQLKQGWQSHWQEYRGRTLNRAIVQDIEPPEDKPPKRPDKAWMESEQSMAQAYGSDYIDEKGKKREERGFKDPNSDKLRQFEDIPVNKSIDTISKPAIKQKEEHARSSEEDKYATKNKQDLYKESI